MRGREWAALWGLGAALLAGAAVVVTQPGYMDAHYYFGGAVQLARGRGFTEPYLWNYLAPVRSLPAPSHLYWMPLTSIVAAPFLALAEWAAGRELANAVLFRAAQIPLVAAGAGLATLAGWVSWRTTGLRRHAWAAGLLTLFSAFYFPFWLTTDSFALFGLAVAGALIAGERALETLQRLVLHPSESSSEAAGLARRARRELLAAGLLAGLAHLARADGVLVLLGLLLFFSVSLWRAARLQPGQPSSVPHWSSVIRWLLFLVLGYLILMLPWFLRNVAVVGAPLAPGGTRALWLIDYADLFTYTPEALTVERYLAAGWDVIAGAKWQALVAQLQSLIAVQGNIAAFPFILIGAGRLRRQPLFQAAVLYGGLLFLAMTFAFTWPGLLGGFLHSGAALLPFMGPAALVGLDAGVEAAARRLKHWQPERSKPIFMALLVVSVAGLALLRFPAAAAGTRAADAVYGEIGEWLRREAGGPAVVVVNNPPAFHYHTGWPAIVVPAGGPDRLWQAMTDFEARWLVLDVNVVAELAALYDAPTAEPRLRLRATFQDSAGRPVYLLERLSEP